MQFLICKLFEKDMSLTIKILGCGSALPTTYRNASAQIIDHNGKIFLTDCAESTQISMRKANVRFTAVNNIFISHLHGDHYFGLFGLLSSFSLAGRKQALTLHCPERLKQMLLSEFPPLEMEYLGYELKFNVLDSKGVNKIYEDKTFEVFSVPLKHRIPVWGFIFKEKIAQRNIIKSCIEKYKLSIAEIVRIKAGSDLYLEDGTIIPNKELTLDPPHPKSYAYISDTVKIPQIAEAVKGVDVLYHEATYEASLAERAKETFHCTTLQAAQTALEAGVGKLVLGHFSGRYQSTEMLQKEAQTVFENTVCAYDGMEFEV